MRVVYVDALLFLNFAVDYMLLFLTARVSGRYIKTRRLLLGSIISALFAVLFFFLVLPTVLSLLSRAVVCIVTVLLTFGRPSARLCGTFFLLTNVLAGILFALVQINGRITVQNGAIYYEISSAVMLISFTVIFLVTQVVLGRGRAHVARSFHEILVQNGDVSICFRALEDSGNLLRDPITGRPVIVVDGSILAPLLPEKIPNQGTEEMLGVMREHLQIPVRLMPVETVTSKELMPVFQPEKLLIDGKLESAYLLGITKGALNIGGDCRALMGVSCQ